MAANYKPDPEEMPQEWSCSNRTESFLATFYMPCHLNPEPVPAENPYPVPAAWRIVLTGRELCLPGYTHADVSRTLSSAVELARKAVENWNARHPDLPETMTVEGPACARTADGSLATGSLVLTFDGYAVAGPAWSSITRWIARLLSIVPEGGG